VENYTTLCVYVCVRVRALVFRKILRIFEASYKEM
jgi:hypothetical protein